MRQKFFYEPRLSKVLMWASFLLAILAGLYVAQFDIGPILGSYWWLSLLVLLFFIRRRSAPVRISRRSILVGLVIIFIGLQLGLWRGALVKNQLSVYKKIYGQDISLTGFVSDDPAYETSYGKTQYEFHIDHVATSQGQSLPGSLRIRTNRGVSLKRGYKVQVSGQIYPTLSNSQQGSIGYASVDVLSMDQSWLEHVRQRFIAGVDTSLPEPEASLGLGYLIGIRSSIPAALTLALVATGLTHIVAVSGYNLTIIIQTLRKLMGKLSRYQNLMLSLLCIGLFVLCTGNSPSIARATVISILALLGWYYGRNFKPLILILWGAVITAMISPSYIWGNVGWYLSFLAFVGILLLAPILRQIFFSSDKEPKLLGEVLLETTCAELLTLPYIIAIFGKVSLVALVTNALVLPLIPFAMLATLIAGIAGAVIPALAGWLAWPAHYLLYMQIWIIETFSRISWAQIQIHMTSLSALVIYLGLGLLAFIYTRKHPLRVKTAVV